MPKYELQYEKSITPYTTYKVVRILRSVEGEEPKKINATDSQSNGYPAEKKINITKNKSLFLVKDERTQSFFEDLLKLHEMVINLIIDLPPTLLLKDQAAYLNYIDLQLSKSKIDDLITVPLSDEEHKQIEAVFKYAEEQRFLSYT